MGVGPPDREPRGQTGVDAQRYAGRDADGSRAMVRGVMQVPGTGRPHEIDPPTSRWLAWHEAVSHGLMGREVRPLGDAVMLYDPADREPFWNRVAGIAWPEQHDAFDRRLTEVLTLFASLERTPHVWPLPGLDEPIDLTRRLLEAGFEDVGAGLLMALDRDGADAAGDPEAARPDVTVERAHRMAGPAAERAAQGIAIVLAEAFNVESQRLAAIEHETLTLLERDEFHAVLLRIAGEPAATARRTTFAGASYLSSIGTRPAFQGRGLGRLATEVAMADALAAGSRWTYLGVFDDNLVARRMYEALGFVVLGGPAPDLLLR
jgi:ribosomal protein S18 acetylase RimI-like enzyme